jgi:acetyltransferase-like isoleucine patch superfamily enzyme
VAQVRQPCFVGSSVKLKGGNQIRLGKGCILQDHVVIDAVSREGVRLGNNVTIDRFSVLKCTGTLRELGQGITIGDNSSIGSFSFVGGTGGVRIGNNVLGGQGLSFHPENHLTHRIDIPIREQGTSRKGIIIEDDCWLGSGSIFLDGVTVGHGSVVAAGSVVNSDIPPYSIAAGVPAKVIRSRSGSLANG